MMKTKKNNFFDKISFPKKDILIIFLVFFFIVLLSLLTSTLGTIDVGDYAGVAKFFTGEYNAKIRSSHSFLYGVVHFPLLLLVKNFILLKIINFFYLFLLVISLYFISNKNRKSLLLFLFSPILWYMGPWINSIQLSSLLFFWSYFFMKKFENEQKTSFLLISGILVGLSWAFWDSILFFSLLLGISFLYNRKFYYSIFWTFFVLIGLSPKLIMDQILFNFPFYGILRYFFGMITSILWKGIYGSMVSPGRILSLVLFLILIPIFSYKLFSRDNFKKDKKTTIFIGLCLLLIFLNFQIRYILLIYPIILLCLTSLINNKQFKIQLFISIFISILVVIPYIIQIDHSTNTEEFTSLVINYKDVKILENQDKILKDDLIQISKDFPDGVFIVGNLPDSYAHLAMIYWGKDIKEFVSIEDYDLYLKNESNLFSKTISFNPNIQERRALWISGGIKKNENDNTNYSNVKYAISDEDKINIEGFELVKEYEKLNVFEKKV